MYYQIQMIYMTDNPYILTYRFILTNTDITCPLNASDVISTPTF